MTKRTKTFLLVCVIIIILLVCVICLIPRNTAAEPIFSYEAVITYAEPWELPVTPHYPPIITVQEPIELPLPEPEPTYTEDELYMLAAVIYCEAGADSCEDSTRIAIGNVVLNRVADSRFPDTIKGVLEAPRQWGTMSKTGAVFPKRASQQSEAHAVERAYDCARRVFDGERVVSEAVVWAAEFRQGTYCELQQDGFYFCR